MDENELKETTGSAETPAATGKKASTVDLKKQKKKDKVPTQSAEAIPHATGRLIHVDVTTAGVEFALKGKKGKTEVFSLSGMENSFVPAATALLSALVASKAKLRVEFANSGDTQRAVKKLRAHG